MTQELLQQGISASQSGDSRRAIALYEQAIAGGQPDARAHFLLASELASAGDMGRAESAFANAVLLAPEWPIARYQLGLLQFSGGRAAAALVTWAPLFGLDPSNCLAQFVRGFASLAHDDFAQATSHFRAGLALPSDNAALAGDIEKVLARIAQATATTVTTGSAHGDQPSTASHVLVANYGRIGNLH
jgi:Tfp pilus assembly protein PilF